jgi:hypothetical protein
MSPAERKRFERRVRDSHRRWQVLGNLSIPHYDFNDGQLLLKSGLYDLYLASSSGEIDYVHPSWLRHRVRN